MESYGEVFAQNSGVEALNAAAEKWLTEIQRVFRANRNFLIAEGVVFLLTHLACGLFGDTIYRRRVWSDLAPEDGAREEEAEELPPRFRPPPPDSPLTQSDGSRHWKLLRRGGVSIFSPLAYFWLSPYLSAFVMDLVGRFL
jgi:hypothetical protein